MPVVAPQIVIRLGTHAEKDYLKKAIASLDGFVIAANLLEATPGATTSLLVQLAGKKTGKPYYLDPMTYGYGLHLDYLLSDATDKKGKQPSKTKSKEYKRSYKSLAERFDGIFKVALKRRTAITADEFDTTTLHQTCESVTEYQLKRPGAEWAADEEFASYSDQIPAPAAILTPYFFVGGEEKSKWLQLIPTIAKQTVALKPGIPVHSVVCADESLLADPVALEYLKIELPKTKVDGVWFWFSNFNEHSAKPQQLRAFRELVEHLSLHMTVHNMHGGYFSLALSRVGLSTTAHGIGYGEQKDVEPVQGQSTPTVRYYLPTARKRLGVPNIERTFKKLGVLTTDDFHKKICGCTICKGVLRNGLEAFSSFGEQHFANTSSKRPSQTGTAAKLCRFHFLLNRIAERREVADMSLDDIIKTLDDGWSVWSNHPTVANDADHLVRWREALA
jgi:hypothetical protein